MLKNMPKLGTVLITAMIAVWVGVWVPPIFAKKPPPPPAPRAPVPQTGQTGCWNTVGTLIDCTDTGQDGDLQSGVSSPTPRFSDQHDGTVRDNLTGLIWLQDANCKGQISWANALTAANNLADGQCHLSDGSAPGDWHVPSVQELASLVNWGFLYPPLSNAQGDGPWMEGDAFSGVKLGGYWSSTTYEPFPRWAFLVHFADQYIFYYYKDQDGYFLWPVRGGQ